MLYTALDREGALAEMRFHLFHGQPVIPSKIRYSLHELAIDVSGVIDITDWTFLERFGVEMAVFGNMPCLTRETEYSACQRSSILVSFPDVPEALTEGATKQEALTEAKDCLIAAR